MYIYICLLLSLSLSIYIYILVLPQTELALWSFGALKAGEGRSAERASVAVPKMILAYVF